jgi:hypothetical protein
MTTITNSPASWVSVTSNQKYSVNLWRKWLAIADGQAKNKAVWFVASLVIMGVLFLPLPAVLIYSYNASLTVLLISMILFFSNFIAGMGGSGIRTTLSLFAISIVVYIIMAAIYIL